jgi:hypothetical protein
METGLLTLGLGCVAGFYRKKFHTARWLWLDNSELAEFVNKYFYNTSKKISYFLLAMHESLVNTRLSCDSRRRNKKAGFHFQWRMRA